MGYGVRPYMRHMMSAGRMSPQTLNTGIMFKLMDMELQQCTMDKT